MDKERTNFGLKQQKLGQIYIKVLGLDPHSFDAMSISNYKDPGKGKMGTGDFAETLKAVLQPRYNTNIKQFITVDDVNIQLDLLAAGDSEQKENVIKYFFYHCTVNEQVWLIRIILKGLLLY